MIISAFALGSVIWFGGLQAQVGGITIGGIQAFVTYITFMIWPIQDLARVYAEMQRSIASAERIFSLLDTSPQIFDSVESSDAESLRGDIEFDQVCFYYDDDDEIVLENFSILIKRGETIALVGPTGGGKSTIVNLLCRFFEPRGGKIFINGQDYTNLTLDSIQSRIGIVLQTPHLFSGSIEENIRYGKLDANKEEIIKASKLAGAHEFISTLDNAYQEEVGEGGNLLSVGQKQLISLARAVLRKPDIFIMDEATSSVDTITESLIQQGMENLMLDRTSIIIAHRLSTIRKADRILYIKDGAIAEIGSHQELIRQKGYYYRLYTQQFRQDMAIELGAPSLSTK
jgi:ATP-binding cassette subfamily B protein